MSLRPALLRLLLVPLLAPWAAAQGLVQIALEGALSEPGGGRVVLSVEAFAGSQLRRASLDLHLAQGTDAHSLAALLADRAQALDLALLYPGAAPVATPAASVFFAHVQRVEMRLPAGLNGRIVACEDAPSAVRFLPPRPQPTPSPGGKARFLMAVTTLHPITGHSGRVSLDLELPRDGSAARASEQLFTRTVEAGWTADRPANDSWRPLRVADSSLVRGLSVEIRSDGPDWGLGIEFELPAR